MAVPVSPARERASELAVEEGKRPRSLAPTPPRHAPHPHESTKMNGDEASPPRKRPRTDSWSASGDERGPRRPALDQSGSHLAATNSPDVSRSHHALHSPLDATMSAAATFSSLLNAPPSSKRKAGEPSAPMDTAVSLASLVDSLSNQQANAGMEESNTDDEDLQQLSMVVHNSANSDLQDGVAAGVVGPLNYEDVRSILFQSARDQKIGTLQKCFRIVKMSTNGEELLRQLVQAEDDTGLTLLMIAVRNNMLRLCAFLVQIGADVNHCNEKRSYALLLSAQKGLEEMTKFLLDNAANEESKNMALIPAAHFGHQNVVQLLLAYHADQNYANKKGTTPLMRAAQEGRAGVVQFLLDSGADACAANNEGMTALMLAAQRGHAQIATLLIDAGSNVNKQTRQGSTALLLAAKRGHTAAVEALLTAGADIFLKDDRDKTPADIAKRRGHAELCFKITVTNQLSLMREDLRRHRSFELMRLSSLYLSSRAEFAPVYRMAYRQRYHELLDRTMRLPRPLLQNVALYLPLCGMWEHQLRYLVYQTQGQPNYVVQRGIQIIDDVLRAVCLDFKASLRELEVDRRMQPSGQLALLRDCADYRHIFTSECRIPMTTAMLQRLRKMADIQGALTAYMPGPGISFGEQVAQDVCVILDELLRWDNSRKRAETCGPRTPCNLVLCDDCHNATPTTLRPKGQRATMEFLVHNISHSDLVVELSCFDDDAWTADQSASPAPAPTKRTQKLVAPDGTQIPLSLLARPKFSLFQQTSKAIMDKVEQLRAGDSQGQAYARVQTPSPGAESPGARPAQLHPSMLDIAQEQPKKSRYCKWKAKCQDTQSPIGFKLDECPIPVANLEDFQIRGGIDTVKLVETHWKKVAITAVYFPLIALLVPKWLQVLKEFTSASSKQLIYLMSGAGIPRNVAHSVQGNSTEITAKLIGVFVRQYYPQMDVIQVHSGSNIFRFDDNVQFMTRELRPSLEAHREKLVDKCGDAWKSHFHVTIAYTDGPPARLSALNASLRIYRPSYLHIWQLKTFWHERKLAMDDVDFHSFENIEASPCVAYQDADQMTQTLVKEMRVFRDQFLQGEAQGEVESFWLRKSRKPVLAVLLIEKEDEHGKKKLVVHRGMNCEVSMPTGSLCAERNAIGSALARDPTLRRRSLKMIGVLGLNLGGSRERNSTTFADIPQVTSKANAESPKHKPMTPPASAMPAHLSIKSPKRPLENSNLTSPRKPKRPRTYSCDDFTVDAALAEQQDRNPLAPCGACKEWLLKIAEANPSFKVVTFENSRCKNFYINQLM
ncbi:TPA: hypothetical protein N0F65_003991 [Lagenidium giganteum]|uniref:Uncharacterized protein n=1 Tax=Lagenidium giganteum TaxID=4803 RepID=A0AAV2YXA3_9STRA|nr:TPA: hypothetical protein N0F65_003991 [Lagenidium giganteum]